MEKKQTISACMITKDEGKLLEECLLSIKDIANEIIVVDTGSADDTIGIAQKYGARIFEYPWDGSFSNARNFSMRQASCDWILLMDADERLIADDKEKLFQILTNEDFDGAFFTIYNYVGEGDGTNYSLHNTLRLVRNNKQYEFRGDIHEQINRLEGKVDTKKFTVLDVRLKHLGYLDWVIADKDKRKRNIPMLQKQLEQDLGQPFTLFNLGNEYMALKDYPKAYEYYEMAMENYNKNEAFSPHLLFRMATCLMLMKKYSDAIDIADKALKLYPRCTDFEFLKGLVYWEWKRYTMAIDSFNQSVKMGEPPLEARFSDDCSTVKPYYSLGQLYMYLHDYPKALEAFNKVLQINNGLYYILYDIADILNVNADKNEVEKGLLKYFDDINSLPNLLILTDIFIKIGLYDIAEKYIRIMQNLNEYSTEKIFLEGKHSYYVGDFHRAEVLLKEAMRKGKADFKLFPNLYSQCRRYIFATSLICGNPKEGFLYVQQGCDKETVMVYKQVAAVYEGTGENVLADIQNVKKAMNIFEELLSTILQTKKFELFEKILYTYNYFESKEVLISLAGVYFANGYSKMAADTVSRSISELNTINHEGVEILQYAFFC